MSPDVYKGQYSFGADLWSLCATFYFVFKNVAPYYTNKELNKVQIVENKWHCTNYEKLTSVDCNDKALREIINSTLTKKRKDRMSIDDMIDGITKTLWFRSNYEVKMQARKDLEEREIWKITVNENNKTILQVRDSYEFDSEDEK